MAAFDLNRREVLQSPEFVKLGVFSAWFGTIAVLAAAVTQIAHPEYEPLMTMIHLMLTATTAASIMYLAARAGSGITSASLPLIINIGIVLILLFMPFDQIWESAAFRLQRGSFQYIVEQAQQGALQPNADGLADLPLGYRNLSENGQVYLWRENGELTLFFVSKRSGSQAVSGHYYRSDGQLPSSAPFNASIRWKRVEQRANGWFYCSTR